MLIVYIIRSNTKNKEEALKYFIKAAEKDHIKAMVKCARIYDNGDGVPVDKCEAAKYYKMTAD